MLLCIVELSLLLWPCELIALVIFIKKARVIHTGFVEI